MTVPILPHGGAAAPLRLEWSTGSIPAPASELRSDFVVNGALAWDAGSIDSLAAASSPLRASSMSLGSRRLHSRPRLRITFGFCG
jgi:hypothetical protein